MHVLVSIRLDSSNSLLYSTYIQRTQNIAARIEINIRQYDDITAGLHHWLQIQEQIDFKVLCLTYIALYNILTEVLTQNNVSRYS